MGRRKVGIKEHNQYGIVVQLLAVKDFMGKYIDRKDFKLIQMDEDYLQITIDSVIKDGLNENVIEKCQQRIPVLFKKENGSNRREQKSNLI